MTGELVLLAVTAVRVCTDKSWIVFACYSGTIGAPH